MDSEDEQQILDKVITEFVALQEKCGIPAKLSIEIERDQLNELITAIREVVGPTVDVEVNYEDSGPGNDS